MSDLLPCPFCGGAARAFRRTCDKNTPYDPADRAFPIVRCGACGACSEGDTWTGRQTAIDKWNRRAQPAQAVPLLSDDELKAHIPSSYRGDVYLGYNKTDFAVYGRKIEQAVRAKLGVAVPMTAAGQMFAEAKKAVGVTFRVNPNLDAETVRQAHVAVSEAPPYELPDWQKAALCVCREVVAAWGSEESRAAHGIVGKEGA